MVIWLAGFCEVLVGLMVYGLAEREITDNDILGKEVFAEKESPRLRMNNSIELRKLRNMI